MLSNLYLYLQGCAKMFQKKLCGSCCPGNEHWLKIFGYFLWIFPKMPHEEIFLIRNSVLIYSINLLISGLTDFVLMIAPLQHRFHKFEMAVLEIQATWCNFQSQAQNTKNFSLKKTNISRWMLTKHDIKNFLIFRDDCWLGIKQENFW